MGFIVPNSYLVKYNMQFYYFRYFFRFIVLTIYGTKGLSLQYVRFFDIIIKEGNNMANRETRDLEYKSDISNTFLKTISAYANYGEGRIIFGISDDGKVKGIDGDLEQLCLDIENKINDSLKPVPSFTLYINKTDKIIELKVIEGLDKPYLYKSKAFKRSDSSTVEVDRLELNRLILEGINQNYEQLPAYNQDLIFKSLKAELIEVLDIKKVNMDILKTLDLYSDKNGFNRAAELLADINDFPGLDMVRFGKNIDEFLDRQSIQHISVIDQFNQGVTLFRKYYQYEVVEGSKRNKIETIPEKAFREVLANSIVYRVWDTRSAIKISMYDDRVEISSPGGLPFGISKDEYLYRQGTLLRNPILASVFFKLGYIEKFGTGSRRINYSYEESIFKPEFIVFENSIKVILPLLKKDLNVLNKEERLVFDLLKSGKASTRLEIESSTQWNKSKVIRVLNLLIDKNSIKRIGQGIATKYTLL